MRDEFSWDKELRKAQRRVFMDRLTLLFNVVSIIVIVGFAFGYGFWCAGRFAGVFQ